MKAQTKIQATLLCPGSANKGCQMDGREGGGEAQGDRREGGQGNGEGAPALPTC